MQEPKTECTNAVRDGQTEMKQLLKKIEMLVYRSELQAEEIAVLEKMIKENSQKQFMAQVRSMPRTNLRFALSLAHHCDLNCVGCSRFSPIAEPEFADFEETERDFKRLHCLFGGDVSLVQLMGGEPLLHPRLTDFFEIARREFPRATIELRTNGIKLLAQSEDFWSSCYKNDIFIKPSKYPIQLDYDAMEECAKQHQVKYEYCDGKEPIKAWIKLAKDPQSTVSGGNEFLNCTEANMCINLAHGRLYTCGVPIHAKHFNKYFGETFELSANDSIDIYQAQSGKEILEFLSHPIPFCRYCRISKNKNISWCQSKKDIKEWIC